MQMHNRSRWLPSRSVFMLANLVKKLVGSIQRAEDEGRPAKEITAIYQKLIKLHPGELSILNQYVIFHLL